MVGIESGRYAGEFRQAALQKPCSYQQRYRQPNLYCHQSPLYWIAFRDLRLAAFGEGGGDAATGATQGWQHSAQESDGESRDERVADAPPIQRDLLNARQIGCEAAKEFCRSGRKPESSQRAEKREQKDLCEQLRDHIAA